MSDESQGEGWYQASDGKWYPPAAPPPPPAEPTKKRGCLPWLLGGVVAVVIIVAIAAAAGGGGNNDDDDGDVATDDVTTETTISKGLGSKDATSDVTSIVIEPADAIGLHYVTVTITNLSEGRSDYFVDVNIESPDGGTRYGSASVYVPNLEPGQTTTEQGLVTGTTGTLPADAVAKPTGIQRTASV